MNLVYMFAKKSRLKESVGIVLNTDYEVNSHFEEKRCDFTIKKIKNNNSLYKTDKIFDSFLVVGKNGSGKSTILDMILFNSLYHEVNNKLELFFFFEKNNEYFVYSTDHLLENPGKILVNGVVVEPNVLNSVSNMKEITGNSNYYAISIKKKDENYCYVYNKMFEISNSVLRKFGDSDVLESVISNYEIFSNFVNKEIKIRINFKNYNSYYVNYEAEKFKNLHLIKRLIDYYLDIIFDKDPNKSDETTKKLKNLRKDVKEKVLSILNDEDYTLYENLFEELNEELCVLTIEKANDLDRKSDLEKEIRERIKKYNKVKYLIKDLYKFAKNKSLILKLYQDHFYLKVDDVLGCKKTDNLDFIKYLFDEYSELLKIEFEGSFGEQSIIELMACISGCIDYLDEVHTNESTFCYLLLDEIEQGLHPEWCRIIYKRISEIINQRSSKHKFFIFLSTHSPYILSDFTSDHIINLNNLSGGDFQTFGANIYDILSKGMFLDNPMGEYALNMIKKLNGVLAEKNGKEETLKKIATELNLEYTAGIENEEIVKNKLLYFINSIGEPLIKMRLELLWKKLEKTWKVDENIELYRLVRGLSCKEKERLINYLEGEIYDTDK